MSPSVKSSPLNTGNLCINNEKYVFNFSHSTLLKGKTAARKGYVRKKDLMLLLHLI